MHENQVDTLRTAERDRLKFPEWQVPLQDLILECDRAKLNERMQRVETLISERLQQLHGGMDGYAERLALTDALSVLRVIKREKLNFPDWK
jgi:hypothetical protein